MFWLILETYTDECNNISDEYAGVSVILAISSMITGLAEAFIIPLSISYLDNNVKKSKMPMMLTLTSFVRMLAPLVGFSLASYCLKIYVEPNLKPLIQNDDPRWIGAWWMGWFVQAVVLLFLAPFLGNIGMEAIWCEQFEWIWFLCSMFPKNFA